MSRVAGQDVFKSAASKAAHTCHQVARKAHAWVIRTRNLAQLRRDRPKIGAMRGRHVGERCFIIGNGPSLTADDVSRLRCEYTFGTNRIYEIYDRTEWRPTYYCIHDMTVAFSSRNDINEKIRQEKIKGVDINDICPRLTDEVCIKRLETEFDPLPEFSDDLEVGFYDGMTVTYTCLQMAVYMGFTEIYLLGVDNNYSKMIDSEGNVIEQQNFQDHFSENDKLNPDLMIPDIGKMDRAYMAAKQYADSHGIRIYNATRGGKLEVFERVDFDSLF